MSQDIDMVEGKKMLDFLKEKGINNLIELKDRLRNRSNTTQETLHEIITETPAQTPVEILVETQDEIQVETQVETQVEAQVETQAETQVKAQVETQAETHAETQGETQVEIPTETPEVLFVKEIQTPSVLSPEKLNMLIEASTRNKEQILSGLPLKNAVTSNPTSVSKKSTKKCVNHDTDRSALNAWATAPKNSASDDFSHTVLTDWLTVSKNVISDSSGRSVLNAMPTVQKNSSSDNFGRSTRYPWPTFSKNSSSDDSSHSALTSWSNVPKNSASDDSGCPFLNVWTTVAKTNASDDSDRYAINPQQAMHKRNGTIDNSGRLAMSARPVQQQHAFDKYDPTYRSMSARPFIQQTGGGIYDPDRYALNARPCVQQTGVDDNPSHRVVNTGSTPAKNNTSLPMRYRHKNTYQKEKGPRFQQNFRERNHQIRQNNTNHENKSTTQFGGGIYLEPKCLTHTFRVRSQSVLEGVGQNIINGHNNHTHNSGYNNRGCNIADGYNNVNGYGNANGFNNVNSYNNVNSGYITVNGFNNVNGYNNVVSGCNNTSTYNNTPSYVLSGYTNPGYNNPSAYPFAAGYKNATVPNDCTGYIGATSQNNFAGYNNGLINPMVHTIPASQHLASTSAYNAVPQQQWPLATAIAHTGHNVYNISQFEMGPQATQQPCSHYLAGNRLIFDPN